MNPSIDESHKEGERLRIISNANLQFIVKRVTTFEIILVVVIQGIRFIVTFFSSKKH